ncbi:MAG: YitT family protein [Clostridia bacterium]|nr:YitT family protein [Clostridia bacterium]
MNKIGAKKEILNIAILVPTSVLVAIGLWVFVYKADFAPSGVDGIATMLQYLTHVNAGIFTFALNFPLLIAAWFILNRRYVIYTLIYIAIVSVTLLLLEKFQMYQYTENDIVAAIFGGVAQGITGILLKIGGSSGGVDVLGCMIQKKVPHKDVEKIISYLSYIIVAIGFIVYGNLHSVLLSVIEIFICERITGMILRDRRNAVKFEIVVDKSRVETVREKIIFELRHGATIMDAEGAFSEENKALIVCLVSYRQIPEFLRLIKEFDDAFVYYSDVMGVRGNFDWRKEEESEEDRLKLLEKKRLSENKADGDKTA